VSFIFLVSEEENERNICELKNLTFFDLKYKINLNFIVNFVENL
jgi:hypothetical protein